MCSKTSLHDAPLKMLGWSKGAITEIRTISLLFPTIFLGVLESVVGWAEEGKEEANVCTAAAGDVMMVPFLGNPKAAHAITTVTKDP